MPSMFCTNAAEKMKGIRHFGTQYLIASLSQLPRTTRTVASISILELDSFRRSIWNPGKHAVCQGFCYDECVAEISWKCIKAFQRDLDQSDLRIGARCLLIREGCPAQNRPNNFRFE